MPPASEPAAPAVGADPEAWRRPFRRLVTGAATSALGNGMWIAAIPPLAASLTRSPVAISLIESAAALPALLFGLAGGAAADRFARRTLLWSADVLCVAVVGALALLVGADAATIPAILVASFLLGTAGTVTGSAFPAFVPEFVPRPALASANSTMAIAGTVGVSFAGPALGALLYGWHGWSPLAVDALTFGVSAACVLSLRGVGTTPLPGTGDGLLAGVRWVAGDRTVRVLAGALVLLGLGTAAVLGVLVLFAQDDLHLPRTWYGLLLTIYAIGTIGGGLTSRYLIRRIGLRRAVQLAAGGGVVAWAGLAASGVWWVAAVFLVLLGLVSMVWWVAELTLRQALVPGAMLGRVSSVLNLLGGGAIPLGATLGGLVAHWFGLRSAIFLAAALTLVATAILVRWLPPMEERSAPPLEPSQPATPAEPLRPATPAEPSRPATPAEPGDAARRTSPVRPHSAG
jgi:MFS family permease